MTHKSTHDPYVFSRLARGPDAAALQRLAGLDSRRPLEGDPRLAEVRGRIVAVNAPDAGHAIADLRGPTADAVRGRSLRAPAHRAARKGRGLLARLGLA